MAESPNKNAAGLVRCSVYSENQAIKGLFGLISISVSKGINQIGRALLVFDAGNMPAGEVPESDDDTFSPGKKIRIEAGYQNDENTIFEGIVTSHNLSIQEGNDTTLQIECCDYAFPATLSRKNRVFAKSKDSDAISSILGNYSPLQVSVDPTKTKHNELVQYYCTDWDFVLSRADANGLVVVTEGKQLKVKKPDVGATPVLRVSYGTDLIEFQGELQTWDQFAQVEAVAWDAASQKLIKTQASKPALNKQGTTTSADLSRAVGDNKFILQTDLSTDEVALKSWADSQFLKTGLARIRGNFSFHGSHKVIPGCIIEIDGFGKRFSGNVYVGSVDHEIMNGEWTTTVGIGISAENITSKPDVVCPPASGWLPGIQGLHIGKITKLNDDPTKEFKVQVEIPILNGDTNLVWARLANFWASNKYGSFFIPDVGDEVVLGFFNNDPCHAVVLGSLYSSKQAPPYQIEAPNNTRAIVTRSKMKIEFEEEKKIITIETPGKNKVEINDDTKSIKLTDQNSNKIELTNNGILIDSAKSITLKSKTNIVLDAGTNIEMKAKSNVTAKGINIEASADTSFTAKGNAKAELSASGQTIVKGAMVMIN